MSKPKLNAITWPWLGGFFQAEGCIQPHSLDISQADKKSLDLIRDFLLREIPNAHITNIYGPYTNKGKGIYQLRIYKNSKEVLTKLLSYLHGEKLVRAHSHLITESKPLPIEDEWVIGFWEGDGAIRNSGNILEFCQKDRTVLDEVQKYLNLGKVRLHADNNMHRLCISINKTNVERIGELLSLVRTPTRLKQLKRILS